MMIFFYFILLDFQKEILPKDHKVVLSSQVNFVNPVSFHIFIFTMKMILAALKSFCTLLEPGTQS